MVKYKKIEASRGEASIELGEASTMRVMWGRFKLNTQIFQLILSNTREYSNIQIMGIIQIMWVITCMFYVSNASNASNYSHYLHDFMWVLQVITRIICSICEIHIFQFFEYFKSNNKLMQVIQGGFEASIGPMLVM